MTIVIHYDRETLEEIHKIEEKNTSMNEKQIEAIRTKYMVVVEAELEKIIGGDKPEDWAGRIQIEEFENTSVTMISVDDKPHTRISLIFGDDNHFTIKVDYAEGVIV